MEDKKYIVSGPYLALVREKVKEMMATIEEEPLIFDVKRAKMLNRLSEIVEMLSPDIAQGSGELMPHVCRCKGGKDGEKENKDQGRCGE